MSAQSKLGRGAASRLGRLHAAQRARCLYCERPLTLRQPGEPVSANDATIDHFFPRSEGGSDSWRNWVLACRSCNHSKANRQPTEPEIEAWNLLSAAWPYIRPIEMHLVQAKRCLVCNAWINPGRLGDSIRAGAETETCRPRCGRSRRHALRPATLTATRDDAPAAPPPVSVQASPRAASRWPLLSGLAALLRRGSNRLRALSHRFR